jgi:hypothetical protein
MGKDRVEVNKNTIPNSGMYIFTCKCGSTMSNNAHNTNIDIIGGAYYRCKGKFNQRCNKQYSAKYFSENAIFVAPKEEV